MRNRGADSLSASDASVPNFVGAAPSICDDHPRFLQMWRKSRIGKFIAAPRAETFARAIFLRAGGLVMAHIPNSLILSKGTKLLRTSARTEPSHGAPMDDHVAIARRPPLVRRAPLTVRTRSPDRHFGLRPIVAWRDGEAMRRIDFVVDAVTQPIMDHEM